MEVAVLGAGAAGFFAAISCKTHHPSSRVIIYEKTNKILAKVKVSGGGRCNVTNACFEISGLVKNYPRGGKELKKTFEIFNAKDTVNWFESRGVKLKTEPDNRMFPVTNNSQTIIDCLLKEAQTLGVEIKTNSPVIAIEKEGNRYIIKFDEKNQKAVDKIIIATGGSPKAEGFLWLKNLGHRIESPVPSLFTFNIPNDALTKLMGVSVNDASVKIEGTKLKQDGPLLITHWGLSGPAILKLSAWGARILNEMNYDFKVHVNWLGNMNETQARELIPKQNDENKRKKISHYKPYLIPASLWLFFLEKSGIDAEMRWVDQSKEKLNRLMNFLTNDVYAVKGKTTFKEEFVTCGGVNLDDIDIQTMESKICPGMYFAGEVLDMDGITGGFNFQAAWTTGFIAGKMN